MTPRSLRRAVRSAAFVESVELRRLLSVGYDANFGTLGVASFTDADLPPGGQYDQIVAASTATTLTTVAEISSPQNENTLLVRRFTKSGASLDSDTVVLPYAFDESLTVTDVVVDGNGNTFVAGNRNDPTLDAVVGFIIKLDNSGTLDASFNSGEGAISTDALSFDSQNVQLLSRGGSVYAAYVTGDTEVHTANLLSFGPDGSADQSFGVAGHAMTTLPRDGATINKLLSDGSGLVVVGTTFISDGNGDNDDPQSIYVGRFDATGARDTNFGTNGYGISGDIGYGRVVLNGVTRVGSGFAVSGTGAVSGAQIVVKLSGSGVLDTNFGGVGVVEVTDITLSMFDHSTRTLAADANGTLYVAGFGFSQNFDADIAVVALNATGALDTSFDSDGILQYDTGGNEMGIGITSTPAGALLVTGVQLDSSSGLLLQLAEPVANTAPVVAAVTTAGSVQTGVNTTFSSSFSDADADDTFTVAWNFGDSSGQGPTASAQGSVSASHLYTAAGTYTVTLSVTDSAGHLVTRTGTINVTLPPPPPVPYTVVGGQLSLNGGAAADTVELVKSGANFILTVNGTPYTITNSLGSVVINGGNGADFIRVSSQITIPVTLIGGAGNDTLRGGSGNDVILGDEGDDLVIGRDGQDLLIGGNGSDFLIGREDADILISGTSTLSSNLAALNSIMAEWTSNHGLLVKLANVTGLLPLAGRLNGNNYLTPNVTVFNDNNVDTLSGGDGADLYYISLFGLNSDVIRDGQNTFAANIAALVFGD